MTVIGLGEHIVLRGRFSDEMFLVGRLRYLCPDSDYPIEISALSDWHPLAGMSAVLTCAVELEFALYVLVSHAQIQWNMVAMSESEATYEPADAQQGSPEKPD